MKKSILFGIIIVFLLATAFVVRGKPPSDQFQLILDRIAELEIKIDQLTQCSCTCIDNDEDGYGDGTGGNITCPEGTELDCDDSNPDVHPGAIEVCDNLDNDCDGEVDEGLTQSCPLQEGVCLGAIQTCTSGVWPDCYYGDNYEADETTCDDLDNDCDGEVDEGGVCGCIDNDEDGYGDGTGGNITCPEGTELDCDDSNPDIYPGAIEVCDGLDNNCEGGVDEGLTQSCPLQEGVCLGAIQTCTSGVWSDCDYGPYYEADEITCDGLDNDCDGLVDEGC